jgi:hypothetical protein
MSKRLYKYVIFLQLLLPACLSTLAQETPALAQEISTQAQGNGKDSLRAAFSRYRSQTPQEKLFVHIDRTFYLAGETIWFKVYDIDGNSDKPLALSANNLCGSVGQRPAIPPSRQKFEMQGWQRRRFIQDTA